MPSFDITSEVDMVALRNAVEGANRKITGRYDFKGSDARVEQADALRERPPPTPGHHGSGKLAVWALWLLVLATAGSGWFQNTETGFELGADDYVVKPFEPREMIARVRSILRRYPGPVLLPANPDLRVAEFAGWRFEPGSNTLTSPGGQSETLSTAEAQLLSVLLAHPNHILTREQLLDGRDVSALDRSIDLRISRLRRRFEENPQYAKLIKTVYGAGYLLAATVSWN